MPRQRPRSAERRRKKQLNKNRKDILFYVLKQLQPLSFANPFRTPMTKYPLIHLCGRERIQSRSCLRISQKKVFLCWRLFLAQERGVKYQQISPPRRRRKQELPTPVKALIRDTLNAGAELGQFFFDAIVAAIDVINAVNHGFTFGCESR